VLFAFSVTIAIAVNAWVPAPTLLFLVCVAPACLLGARPSCARHFAYLRGRTGLRWMGVSLAVSLLLVAPVLALYIEFRLVDELFRWYGCFSTAALSCRNASPAI